MTITEPDTTKVVLDAIHEVHALLGDDLDRLKTRVEHLEDLVSEVLRAIIDLPAGAQGEPEQGVTVEDDRMFLPGTGWVQR